MKNDTKYVLVPAARRCKLINLRPGALFVTDDGCMAVKSEYFMGGNSTNMPQCVLLESGEYGWFGERGRLLGGDMLVRELILAELHE